MVNLKIAINDEVKVINGLIKKGILTYFDDGKIKIDFNDFSFTKVTNDYKIKIFFSEGYGLYYYLDKCLNLEINVNYISYDNNIFEVDYDIIGGENIKYKVEVNYEGN